MKNKKRNKRQYLAFLFRQNLNGKITKKEKVVLKKLIEKTR